MAGAAGFGDNFSEWGEQDHIFASISGDGDGDDGGGFSSFGADCDFSELGEQVDIFGPADGVGFDDFSGFDPFGCELVVSLNDSGGSADGSFNASSEDDDDDDYDYDDSASSAAAPATPSNSEALLERVPENALSLSFHYVTECPDELECAICLSPLIDPVLAGCGEHCFCMACLDQLSSEAKCPSCRGALRPVSQLRGPSLKILNALKVRCTRDGCEWMGARTDLSAHLHRTCATFLCAHASVGCEWRGKRNDARAHFDDECEYHRCRMATIGCEWRGTRHSALTHLANECELAPQRCNQTGCAWTGSISERAVHIESCPVRALAEREREVAATAVLCEQLNPSESEIVKLDVSGKLFKTTHTMLAKFPHSLLGIMSETGFRCDGSGIVTLDADPHFFSQLMTYLRYDTVPMFSDDYSRRAFVAAARIWRFHELVEQIEGRYDGGARQSSSSVAASSNGREEEEEEEEEELPESDLTQKDLVKMLNNSKPRLSRRR